MTRLPSPQRSRSPKASRFVPFSNERTRLGKLITKEERNMPVVGKFQLKKGPVKRIKIDSTRQKPEYITATGYSPQYGAN